jgi:hypothetical protein
MSNFPCATASATQKNLISMDRECCLLTVLVGMLTAVELLQLMGGGGLGVAHFFERESNNCGLFAI